MNGELTGFIAIAMSVIGFITVWVKMGYDKGREKSAIESLERRTQKNEDDITELEKETRKGIGDLKNETLTMQIDIARSMGAIEAKLDYIKEVIDELKGR